MGMNIRKVLAVVVTGAVLLTGCSKPSNEDVAKDKLIAAGYTDTSDKWYGEFKELSRDICSLNKVDLMVLATKATRHEFDLVRIGVEAYCPDRLDLIDWRS